MEKYMVTFFAIILLTIFLNFKDRILNLSIKTSEIRRDFVPDSLTAKKIAEAIWLPIYGIDVLKQRPYSAKLIQDSIWIIRGINKNVRPGGVAYIEIQSKDCKILKVTHSE